jgi:hypothetical protein
MTTSDLTLLGEKKSRDGVHWFGLVWNFFQAMTTCDLPLLGEKKSGDGKGYGANFSLVWFGLLYMQWRISDLPILGEKKSGDGKHWFGLVWYFLQAMMTSDLPLLGEKKSWDSKDCTVEHTFLWFGLVWYFLQAMTTSDIPLLCEKKSGDGERYGAHFSLVWFGLLDMQWRPLAYLSSVRRRVGMASIDLVWFGLVFPPSNHDLWLTSPWWEERGWRALWDTFWFGLVWYILQAMPTSDLPLLGEKKSRDGEHWFDLVWFGISSKQWRPLIYISSVRRRAGMATTVEHTFLWFGLECFTSNDDLW